MLAPQKPLGSGVFQLLVAGKTWMPPLNNTWMYTWGSIAARVLGLRDLSYAPSTFYIEFENVASPSTVASIPTVTPADGRGYYDSIAGSATRDYLRVPILLTPSIDVDPAYSTYLTAGLGNRLTLLAQSTGSVGVAGKTFSNASNSKICGLAWVATPIPGDPTRDLIFARQYYLGSDQQVVPVGGQFDVIYSPTLA
jgi:hypothetical protein